MHIAMHITSLLMKWAKIWIRALLGSVFLRKVCKSKFNSIQCGSALFETHI